MWAVELEGGVLTMHEDALLLWPTGATAPIDLGVPRNHPPAPITRVSDSPRGTVYVEQGGMLHELSSSGVRELNGAASPAERLASARSSRTTAHTADELGAKPKGAKCTPRRRSG